MGRDTRQQLLHRPDTGVCITLESDRPLDAQRIPGEAAVSVVTQAGVPAAAEVDVRARRPATLDAVGSATRAWAQMRVHLGESGRRVAGLQVVRV